MGNLKFFYTAWRLGSGRRLGFILLGLMLSCLCPYVLAGSLGPNDLAGYLMKMLPENYLPENYNSNVARDFLVNTVGRIPLALEPGSGGPSQASLLGWLIGYFNTTMTLVAGGIISSSVVLGTLYSATEGKAMGKLSTAWVPLRSFVGVAFLAPVSLGFSAIQIIVITIVLAGSTVADIIWATSSAYFSQNGLVDSFQVDVLFNKVEKDELQAKIKTIAKGASLDVVSDLYKARICYQFYQDSFKQQGIRDTVSITYDDAKRQIIFPNRSDFNVSSGQSWVYPADCGTFTATSYSDYNLLKSMDAELAMRVNEQWKAYNAWKKKASGVKNVANYQASSDSGFDNLTEYFKSKSSLVARQSINFFMSEQNKAALTFDGIYFYTSWIYAAFTYYNWAFEKAKMNTNGRKISNVIFGMEDSPPKEIQQSNQGNPEVPNPDIQLLFDYTENIKREAFPPATAPTPSPPSTVSAKNNDDNCLRTFGHCDWGKMHDGIDKYIGKMEGSEFVLSSTMKSFVPQRQMFPVIGNLGINAPESVRFPPAALSPNAQAERWAKQGCVTGFSTFILKCGQGRKPDTNQGSGAAEQGVTGMMVWAGPAINWMTQAASDTGWYIYYSLVPQSASEWLVDDIYSFTYLVSKLWYQTFVTSPQEIILNPIGSITIFGGKLLTYSISFMFNTVLDILNAGLSQAKKNLTFTIASASMGAILNFAGAYLVENAWSLLTHCYMPEGGIAMGVGCLIILLLFFPLFIFLIVGAILLVIGIVIKLVGTLATGVVSAFYFMMVQYSMSQQFQYIGLIMGVASPIMAFAAGLLFYIPFIPLIYYMLAVLGWIILVVETMMGLPLMLLGVVNPQGHDLLGTAQMAGMMILSIFLRPITIVIGFVFAIVMTCVSMMVLTSTMIPAISEFFKFFNTITEGQSEMMMGVAIFMTMMLYLYVVKMAVNMSFTLVYKVPVNVMKWLGMPDQPGDEETIRQIEQAIDSAGTSIGQSFSSMGGKMVQTSTSMGTRDPSKGSQG